MPEFLFLLLIIALFAYIAMRKIGVIRSIRSIVTELKGKPCNPIIPPSKRELLLSILPERFIVFDLETTGLSPEFDEIIEIGAIRFYKDRDIWDSFQALVRPKNKIPRRISELTGITQYVVDKNGFSLDFVLIEFMKFIEDLPLVSFNAAFDMAFLDNALAQCHPGIKINNRASCALEMARGAWPGLKSYKLADLCDQLGIKFEGTHRATVDCKRALMVFLEAAYKLRFIEGFEEDLTTDSRKTRVICFQAENKNREELNECKLGEPVNLWVPKNGTPKVNIYRIGTLGGAGKIGCVPFKYSRIISAHLRKGLEYHTKILDLSTGKIECRLISKQETDAKHARAIKRAGERISAVLSNKYKKAPKDNFLISVELHNNHNQKIGDILFIEPKPLDFYIQNPEPLRVNFLDKQGKIIAQMNTEKDKILRILRAFYSNYRVSIKIIEIEEPDTYLKIIEAKAIVSYESEK